MAVPPVSGPNRRPGHSGSGTWKRLPRSRRDEVGRCAVQLSVVGGTLAAPAWYPVTYQLSRPTSPWRGDQAAPTGQSRVLRSSHRAMAATREVEPNMLRMQAPLPERYLTASDDELVERIAS